MTRLVLLCAGFFVFLSCDDHHPDTEKIIQELHAREPKRVTSGQIIALTQDLGRSVTDIATKEYKILLGSDSSATFDSAGLVFADNLGQFEIKLITNKESANKDEAELFSAYMFSQDHVSSDMDNVQDVKSDGYLLYNRPLMIQGAFYGMWSVKYKKGEIVRLYPEE